MKMHRRTVLKSLAGGAGAAPAATNECDFKGIAASGEGAAFDGQTAEH